MWQISVGTVWDFFLVFYTGSDAIRGEFRLIKTHCDVKYLKSKTFLNVLNSILVYGSVSWDLYLLNHSVAQFFPNNEGALTPENSELGPPSVHLLSPHASHGERWPELHLWETMAYLVFRACVCVCVCEVRNLHPHLIQRDPDVGRFLNGLNTKELKSDRRVWRTFFYL